MKNKIEAIRKEKGILQERFAEATARRTFVEADRRYLLIVAPENWVFVDDNSINVYNNSINADNNAQSKVKESKVKYLYSARDAREGENNKPKQGSFDTDSFFDAAVKRSLGEI